MVPRIPDSEAETFPKIESTGMPCCERDAETNSRESKAMILHTAWSRSSAIPQSRGPDQTDGESHPLKLFLLPNNDSPPTAVPVKCLFFFRFRPLSMCRSGPSRSGATLVTVVDSGHGGREHHYCQPLNVLLGHDGRRTSISIHSSLVMPRAPYS